jgi:hypothetical protein
MLIPVAALGHFIGLRMHERMIKSDAKFKRWMGGVLIIVCMVGLLKVTSNFAIEEIKSTTEIPLTKLGQ